MEVCSLILFCLGGGNHWRCDWGGEGEKTSFLNHSCACCFMVWSYGFR